MKLLKYFRPSHADLVKRVEGNVKKLYALNVRKTSEAEKIERKKAKIAVK